VSTLTVVLTHLAGPAADDRMELLRAVAPDARLVVGHGGTRSDYERVTWPEKFFVDDPTLRGPAQHLQSLTQVFEIAWREYVARDAELDSVYVIEYDHLILDPAFEHRLRALASETGADLLGKTCVDRTATNEAHYIRWRRDERLLEHLRRHSVREDPEQIFGALGDGLWLTRRALEAYVNVGTHPPCYCEVYVPTLVHHLGFRVVDIDRHGDLYHHVRWLPEYSSSEVLALARAGVPFVHPAKDPALDAALREIVGDRARPAGARGA